jgi:hypothetical protein
MLAWASRAYCRLWTGWIVLVVGCQGSIGYAEHRDRLAARWPRQAHRSVDLRQGRATRVPESHQHGAKSRRWRWCWAHWCWLALSPAARKPP